MKVPSDWIRTALDPKKITAQAIKVRDQSGREIQAYLEVEQVGDRGQIIVSANYNSSHLPRTWTFASFILTQAQMENFEKKGNACILDVPVKNWAWSQDLNTSQPDQRA